MITARNHVNVCTDTWLLWSYHMSVGKWNLFYVTWASNHCTQPAPAKATILIPQRWSLQAPSLAGHWWWRDTILQPSIVCVRRGKYILWGCLNMCVSIHSVIVIWQPIRDLKVLCIFQISDLLLPTLCKEGRVVNPLWAKEQGTETPSLTAAAVPRSQHLQAQSTELTPVLSLVSWYYLSTQKGK